MATVKRKQTMSTGIIISLPFILTHLLTLSYTSTAFLLPSTHTIHPPTHLSTHPPQPLQLNSNIIETLELSDQFSRWKFLQQLLENELPHSHIEDVLLLTLSSYLTYGPTAKSSNNKDENGGNASPVLTDGQRDSMARLIGDVMGRDGVGVDRFLHLLVLPPVDYSSLSIDIDPDEQQLQQEEEEEYSMDKSAMELLNQIEQLLPDPMEDEESYKSAWDVVIDLYGRESVRVKEEQLQREKENGGGNISLESLEWRTLCAVARVLIHYDFLTKGVLVEGTYRIRCSL